MNCGAFVPTLSGMIPASLLDLSLITEGADAATALRQSGDLARHAEALGYDRYWVAEHHAMPGIASAATSVLIGYLAGQTARLKVGAGGIMLPNHAPLLIAEQFGTLAALYPGRIELGLGRAPGGDQATARALRRRMEREDDFPQDVLELLHYFEPAQPGQMVVATPGVGSEVPVWLLGSSLFSARLAAALGVPFAFASHFAPRMMEEAVQLYRAEFRPSARLAQPYVMLSVNVIAADTSREARRIGTSIERYFIALRSGRPGMFPPPLDDDAAEWPPAARAVLDDVLSCRIMGDAAHVKAGLTGFAERYQPDEVLMAVPIFDHEARRRSVEIVAGLRR